MKQGKSNVVQAAILAVLGLAAVLSLALPQLLRGRQEPQLLSLSVMLRDTDSSGWTVARQGMEQAADELGAELRFLTLTTANDSAQQASLLLREIEDGAAALVAVPADPAALSAALDPWLVVCPMVTLESSMEGAAGVVSPDNALLGERLAEALLEDWDSGEVLLLDTAGRCAGVADRLAAAESVLEGAGVPVCRREALPEEDPKWVLAFEPPATQGAAERKEAEGRTFALYGVGASTGVTAQLERGNIAAIAAWSEYAAGYLAVRQAVSAVRGTEGTLGPLPFSVLREEDIYGPENQKLLFPIMSSSSR